LLLSRLRGRDSVSPIYWEVSIGLGESYRQSGRWLELACLQFECAVDVGRILCWCPRDYRLDMRHPSETHVSQLAKNGPNNSSHDSRDDEFKCYGLQNNRMPVSHKSFSCSVTKSLNVMLAPYAPSATGLVRKLLSFEHLVDTCPLRKVPLYLSLTRNTWTST
jgi:hypothetical protein